MLKNPGSKRWSASSRAVLSEKISRVHSLLCTKRVIKDSAWFRPSR
nr:MAG TPA: hypothetical protein [Caudoviricetes sp.]